jgi:nitrite reductase (NO-forming)
MRFEPATLSVRTGSPVSITLNNVGVIVHDLTVDSIGGQTFQVLANGGQRASGQFTASSAGTFEFYCSQPGHKEAGMTGTLTVQ